MTCGRETAARATPRLPEDWRALLSAEGLSLPEPRRVEVSGWPVGMEGRTWLMVPSRCHQLYFSPSSDLEKVHRLYSHLDGIYEFLAGRSPEPCPTPIRAFLVPGEYGRSRCSLEHNAMRTGDTGDFAFNLSSFLHEETHLFNFAAIGGMGQNWWTGEFSCIYFQERARCALEGRDFRQMVRQKRPNEPAGRLVELEELGKAAILDGASALYFLEETYGQERLDAFRAARLELDRKRGPQAPTAPLFARAFDTDVGALDRHWRRFYGFPDP